MTGDILVVAEHTGQEIDPFSLQLIAKGRQLADGAGRALHAVLIGNGLTRATEALWGSGVDTAFVAEAPGLTRYNPELWTRIIERTVRSTKPLLILMGYTFMGMEIGPALAMKLEGRLVSNCIDVSLSDDVVLVTRPMYGGMVSVQAAVAATRPLLISVQRGVLPKQQVPARPAAEVVWIAANELDADLRTRALEIIEDASGADDLKRAEIVVAVGRGIGERKNISLIEEVADALGAALACSRPVVDNGWLPAKLQVGLSGHVLRPKVYIACGISGASQHLAGMRDSQVIIAINRDPAAPIFRIAHYGVVGDMFQLLPSLVERARKLKDAQDRR